MGPSQRLEQISSQISQTMTESVFADLPLAPADAIFALTAAYKTDDFKDKVNLGVGAYRDDAGKPYVLPVVRKAHELLVKDTTLDHEYLPIAGLPAFTSAAARLLLGKDSKAIAQGRVSSIQTISGTGANHLGALFMAKFNKGRCVYISNPTWANHAAIWQNVGVDVKQYPYWDAKTRGLDIEGYLATLASCPEGSIILIHACAHNPTGIDPTEEQWQKIADVVERRRLFPFFDCAYQGFATGDLERDASAVRYFISRGLELCVAQSFAKNFGLYGERAGAFHWVAPSKDVAARVSSQLAVLQRSEISNPPAFPARIASLVLNDADLFAQWQRELKGMADRIIDMRRELHRHLTSTLSTPGSWEHIITQIGMFSFTGLSAAQVDVLTKKYHIYLTKNGRISMAGLNTSNVEYVARAIDDAVRNA
ncbi:Aspartate aminotransferase, cytoplasmic [Savitreella phatthalungensis]